MIPHDILTLYDAKALEYVIALLFLALFVPFWQYVSGEARPALQPAAQVARRKPARPFTELVEWFRMAPDAFYHPGHAWARAANDGRVAIGVDDFAQKLVGTLKAVELPSVGTRLSLGEPAWRLRVDGKAVDMLSPVDGVVTEVNPRVAASPMLANADPYGEGWLVKVDAPRFEANRRTLLNGRLARAWLEDATNALRMRMSPEVGLALQDGGLPVDGIAHALDPEHWDLVAREFLLTAANDSHASGGRR
jgi:glycine cleavage system H lipoate-binding protein